MNTSRFFEYGELCNIRNPSPIIHGNLIQLGRNWFLSHFEGVTFLPSAQIHCSTDALSAILSFAYPGLAPSDEAINISVKCGIRHDCISKEAATTGEPLFVEVTFNQEEPRWFLHKSPKHCCCWPASCCCVRFWFWPIENFNNNSTPPFDVSIVPCFAVKPASRATSVVASVDSHYSPKNVANRIFPHNSHNKNRFNFRQSKLPSPFFT